MQVWRAEVEKEHGTIILPTTFATATTTHSTTYMHGAITSTGLRIAIVFAFGSDASSTFV